MSQRVLWPRVLALASIVVAIGLLAALAAQVVIPHLPWTASVVGGGRHEAAIPADAEPAIFERGVDGDTIRVVAQPSGSFGSGGSVRVRLLNIDAPELGRDRAPAECGAHAAAARVEALLRPGDLVWLAADVDDVDVYDRPLRGVWTDDGVFLNELLVAEGLATAVLFPPNDRFYATMVAAQAAAQAERAGIWGSLC